MYTKNLSSGLDHRFVSLMFADCFDPAYKWKVFGQLIQSQSSRPLQEGCMGTVYSLLMIVPARCVISQRFPYHALQRFGSGRKNDLLFFFFCGSAICLDDLKIDLYRLSDGFPKQAETDEYLFYHQTHKVLGLFLNPFSLLFVYKRINR